MTRSGLRWTDIPEPALALLRRGTVIPAHPLALDSARRFDRESQRALTRYYIDAGAGGLAVGVHATQFRIREAGLYRPVLQLAAETAGTWSGQPLVLVAGAVGKTAPAVAEAEIARALGYHAVLLGLGAMKGAGEDELIDHCRAVAAAMPLIGFYLQAAVGGIPLSREFWTRFAALDNVIAVKVAPFNRYRTLDVAFGVVAAKAEERVTLYTGNDDHILLDLLTPLAVRAAEVLRQVHAALADGAIPPGLLALDAFITDCNSVIFDVAHDFAGCIPGCHEVLRRQGLMTSNLCLDPKEVLSPGQAAGIDRLYATYPELTDDAFVSANLARWRG
jgi:dihydrodipicolinate synthase/N-acetylneuraminate lyase